MTAAEYLEELKIKPVKRLSQLEDNLIITLGKKKATEIIDTINARGRAERQGRKPDDKKFYSIKHRDFRTSMLISGAFDGDIILRISEWLEDSTVTFGEKVLDIGCENGIITCFLALNHPESHFVGIDRSREAVNCAETLKAQLSITNAEFKVMDTEKLGKSGETFDTVLCSRNIHENLEYFTPDRMELFRIQAKSYEDHLKDYAAFMKGLLKEDGEFVTIERAEIPAFIMGWLMALNEDGLALKELGEINAAYLGQSAIFRVAILKNGQAMDRRILMNTYLDFALRDLGQAGNKPTSFDGAMLLERTAVGLIEGIDLYNHHGIRAARLAVWQCSGGMVIMERHSLGNSMHDYLLLPGDKTENALEVIRNDARNYRNNGFRGEDLKKVLANQGLI